MTVAKGQERQALEQIRGIIKSIGGADSYIGLALEGCLEIAEENIENDFACSMKQRAVKAQADADCFQESTKKLSDELDKAKRENDSLRQLLDTELEWKDYEIEGNVRQDDYEYLVKQSDTRFLTDEEAKDILYDWYGFAKEKLVIQKAVPVYQINRHRRLRKTGEAERCPVYNATDWNYIRFDCGPVSYGLYNDSLKLV